MDFEYLSQVKKKTAFHLAQTLLAYLIAIVFTVLGCFALASPKPIIVISGDAKVPARIAYAGEHKPRQVDAERFLRKVTELALGWSSSTYKEDYAAVQTLVVPQVASQFFESARKQVEVPFEVSESLKSSRYKANISAGISNELTFPESGSPLWRWSYVKGVFHVYFPVDVETQAEEGAPIDSPRTRRSMELKASIIPALATAKNPDGFKVAFWHLAEIE